MKQIYLGLLLLLPQFGTAQLESWDNDWDGMPDPWEFHRSLDWNDPTDAWKDQDQDGVLNIYEYLLGSDPGDPAQPVFIPYHQEQPLEEFIANAPRGSVLQIPDGVYPLHYEHPFDAEAPRVMIQGGWNADFSERDVCQYPTVFEGGEQPILNFLLTEGNSSAIILDGLQLRGGKAGAIRHISYLSKVQLLLSECLVTENEAHPAQAILHFEDGASTLISDLILVNSTFSNNNGSAIRFEQSANRGNFKLLNSLVAFNAPSLDDELPFRSGYGLRFESFADSLLQLQFLNSIIWGNAKADVLLQPEDLPRLLVDSRHNIYGYFENDPNAAFFNGQTDRSTDPFLLEHSTGYYTLASLSPARGTGIFLGMGDDLEVDIGPRACLEMISATEEKAGRGKWILYPNPVTEHLYLATEPSMVKELPFEIRDAFGRIITRGRVPANLGQKPFLIHLKEEPTGLYFFIGLDEEGVFNIPFCLAN
ncbi:MAG: hypothetical protein KTR30_15650 [Saprospiraceae bacterium]|nr:hypothetical protein [Saprospiraceae bacterium]